MARFDFYRCYKCRHLLTGPEVDRKLAGNNLDGGMCPCGSLKLTPSNLPWWGWLLPKVWAFAYQRIRGAA